MRFLVDAQLPPALARWLVERGHRAEHVHDLGMADSPDNAIWEWAERERAIILTKDEDFAIWHDTRGPSGVRIVWLRLGNARKVDLLNRIERLLPQLLERLSRERRSLKSARAPMRLRASWSLGLGADLRGGAGWAL